MVEYVACEVDFDCPTAQLCYTNVSNSPAPFPACFCNSYFGWADEFDRCNGRTATFYVLLVILIVEAVVSGALCVLSCFDSFRVFSIGLERMRKASIIVTSVSLPCSMLLFLVWRMLLLATIITPTAADVSSEGETVLDREKFGQFELAERPVVFLCLLSTATSAAALALMWISISERVHSFQTDSASSWREVLFLFFFFCFISIGVVAVTIDWSITGPTALPFLSILIGMLIYGRKRMLDLLTVAVELEMEQARLVRGPHESEPVSETARKEKRAMRAISLSGLHIIIGSVGILISGVVSFYLNVLGGGWKEFAPVNGFSVITVVDELVPMFTLYILCAIFFYVHRNTNKLITTSNMSKSAGSSNNIGRLTSSSFHDTGPRKQSLNPLSFNQGFPNL